MAAGLDPGLHRALSGEFTPKFLATLDANGKPNCVPIISITPYKDDLLVFGEFLMNKSRANLLVNDRVGIAVFTAANEAWSLKGTFLGFETQGEHIDFVNSLPMFRYNAYTGVRAAGLLRVVETSPKTQLAKSRIVRDFARLAAARPFLTPRTSNAPRMPRPVHEKFNRMTAARALAFRDEDAYPRAVPLVACVAAGAQRIIFSAAECAPYLSALAAGATVALCVITMEPIAYQVKGAYRAPRAGIASLDIAECYSASPPLVGDLLA